jgi:hypothetical protein
MRGMYGATESCRELPKDCGDEGSRVLRRANKSCQRLADMKEGDRKPEAAMSCQIMAQMRGMYGAAATSCSLLEDGGDGGRGVRRAS